MHQVPSSPVHFFAAGSCQFRSNCAAKNCLKPISKEDEVFICCKTTDVAIKKTPNKTKEMEEKNSKEETKTTTKSTKTIKNHGVQQENDEILRMKQWMQILLYYVI